MDYMIGVYAPKSLRVERVMKRDGSSAQSVEDRISRQMDDEEKMRRCDFVITNDEQMLLIPQVIALYERLKNPKPRT
jgi:dephospho-CoA kinase